MSDTWITDLSHFLNKDGSIAPASGPARRLAEYIAAIVVELSADLAEIDGCEKVPCRRRPGRRPCPGVIESWIDPESGDIHWQCNRCGDNGRIGNWEGTMWDLTDKDACH